MFKDSVKCVSRKFQIKFQKFFKNVSMEFLQFYCCMDIIAGTRAEGGLVLFQVIAHNTQEYYIFMLPMGKNVQ